MNEWIRYPLETVITSGILYALYRLLLDRKVGYGWCRAYLVGSLFAGALIPLLQIPVWAGEVVYLPAIGEGEAAAPVGIAEATIAHSSTGGWIVSAIYWIGVGTIFALIARQWMRIRTLRRQAIVHRDRRYSLLFTRQRIASFSFLRTIYIWQQTPEEELAAIIAHESSHIAHHHTVERLVAESLKAFLWWNPFAWLTARLLSEVEEFEADNDVLEAGFCRDEYMTTIFRQLFGYSPDISNGLPHSLTKKRFQMMTRKIQNSHALLRSAAVAATVAGLFCAFSLTTQATEYRTFDASVGTELPADAPKHAVRLLVTDQQGPIVGAIVTVVGSQYGVTTNFNGVATIEAAVGDQLQIAYIGYESRTITLGKENELIVTLTPSEKQSQVDEIVVESYGSPSKEDIPFLAVQQMPRFEGGDINTFRQWVMMRIRPCKNDRGEVLTGRVVVDFVIEHDGTLTIGKVLKTPDTRLSNEVIRVLIQSPKWEAGSQRNQPVRVKYTMPVDFSVR